MFKKRHPILKCLVLYRSGSLMGSQINNTFCIKIRHLNLKHSCAILVDTLITNTHRDITTHTDQSQKNVGFGFENFKCANASKSLFRKYDSKARESKKKYCQ